jgi:hypothetical protein
MAEEKPVRQRRRAMTLDSHEGTLLVRRTAYGEEDETLETIRVPTFATEPGHVRVSGTVTRNMGDSNFVKMEVMLDLPILPEITEAERVYTIASGFVEGRLQQELDNAMGTRGPEGGSSTQAQPRDDGRTEAAGIRRQVQV